MFIRFFYAATLVLVVGTYPAVAEEHVYGKKANAFCPVTGAAIRADDANSAYVKFIGGQRLFFQRKGSFDVSPPPTSVLVGT